MEKANKLFLRINEGNNSPFVLTYKANSLLTTTRR